MLCQQTDQEITQYKDIKFQELLVSEKNLKLYDEFPGKCCLLLRSIYDQSFNLTT